MMAQTNGKNRHTPTTRIQKIRGSRHPVTPALGFGEWKAIRVAFTANGLHSIVTQQQHCPLYLPKSGN